MKRRSRAQWQDLIEEQESSGASQQQFCAERGIAVSSLQSWKRKLKGESFVEIAAAPSVDRTRGAVVELPGGAVLRFSW